MITDFIFSEKMLESERHVRLEKEYYVTDLVVCSLKRQFALKYPTIEQNKVLKPKLLFGELIHLGIQKFIEDNYENGPFVTYAFEVPGERKVNVDGEEYWILGRVDALVKTRSGETIGLEFKSSLSDKNLPKRHHLWQVCIYNWLFDLPKTILVYITPDRFCEFEISEKFNEEDIIRLIREPKAPRWPWECRYCDFAFMCKKKNVEG